MCLQRGSLLPLPVIWASLGQAQSDTVPLVVQWIRHHATAVSMKPIGDMIGDAPLVGLGEGTHGTREFYLVKAHLVEYLVSEKGFRTIAFEGNFDAVAALDDYVRTGRGTPESALAALGGFNWETEELVELLQWLRAYNMDAKHEDKVRLYGIDMLNCYPSLDAALRFIGHQDSAAASRLAQPFTTLLHLDLSGSPATQGRYDDLVERLSVGQPDILVAATEAVVDYLDRHRPTTSDTTDWVMARQHAVIAMQRARNVRTVASWYSSLGMTRSDSLYDRAGPDASALLTFLDARDTRLADTVRPLLGALKDPLQARRHYLSEMTRDQRIAWEGQAAQLGARLEVDRLIQPERASRDEWRKAVEDAKEMVTLLHDFREFLDKPAVNEYEPRDPPMAENVVWVTRHAGGSGKVIVWAHDFHVGASPFAPGFPTMGSALRTRFGARYVALGTLFGHGGFQARDALGPEDSSALVRAFVVGPAAPGSIEAVFAQANLPAFALDLRPLPANTPLQAWFAQPRPARYIGNAFDTTHEGKYYQDVRLSELFDIVVYIDHTTRARPLSEAIRRFNIAN